MHDMTVSRQIEKDFMNTYKKDGIYNLSEPMDEWNSYIDAVKSGVLPLVNNHFISENSKYLLSSKELYFYSMLQMNLDAKGYVNSTLSTLHDKMIIKFSNRKSRSIKSMKDVLNTLIGLKIISLKRLANEVMDANNIRVSDTIKIEFNELGESGYVSVDHNDFESFLNIFDYHIYVVVKRWKNSKEGSFHCDYERFSRILGTVKSTTLKNINAAIERKVIYKKPGVYLPNSDRSKALQSINKYRITPFK